MNGDDIDELNDLNFGFREGAAQDSGQLFGGLRRVDVRDGDRVMLVDVVFLHDLHSPLQRTGIGSDLFLDVDAALGMLIDLQNRFNL